MAEVIIVIGPGQIGQAIARRVGVAKHALLADMRPENAQAAAQVMGNAGYDVSTATVDYRLATLKRSLLLQRALGRSQHLSTRPASLLLRRPPRRSSR
jgi:threonine dehydrogenase-like Zn-dependent dehydrogenase